MGIEVRRRGSAVRRVIFSALRKGRAGASGGRGIVIRVRVPLYRRNTKAPSIPSGGTVKRFDLSTLGSGQARKIVQ